ncbi:hypothetical protein [Neoaquamicrobium sediminum]|uniref:hypothetical protein n=1 Tax=Neoaquamicrobium sediminum TaxID=1849104 RepID=UPI001FD18921|nr:hypothetical protein [Mesorhizobium sediminum]
MHRYLFHTLVASLTVAGVSSQAYAVEETFETETGAIQVSTIASGLSHPWAIAFLPGMVACSSPSAPGIFAV